MISFFFFAFLKLWDAVQLDHGGEIAQSLQLVFMLTVGSTNLLQ